MTIIDQIKKSAEVRRDESFSKWWFLNGGMLHPWWKRRQYSKIKEAAACLPRLAWDKSFEDRNTEIELLAKALEVAIEEIKKICECKTGWSGSDNEYESDFCQSCIAITKITELLKPLLGQDGGME